MVATVGREGATPIKLALGGAALTVGVGAVNNAILMISDSTLDRFRMADRIPVQHSTRHVPWCGAGCGRWSINCFVYRAGVQRRLHGR